jgi:hypothetical protein
MTVMLAKSDDDRAQYVDHCSISRIVAIINCCFLLDYFKEVR